jgi:hypothetical protein
MNASTDPGHGHSPAAWTAVVLMLITLSVGTVAFFFAMWWLVIASFVATVAGWGVGFVLSAMGWGAAGPKFQPKERA